jgi:hypothetical protein
MYIVDHMPPMIIPAAKLINQPRWYRCIRPGDFPMLLHAESFYGGSWLLRFGRKSLGRIRGLNDCHKKHRSPLIGSKIARAVDIPQINKHQISSINVFSDLDLSATSTRLVLISSLLFTDSPATTGYTLNWSRLPDTSHQLLYKLSDFNLIPRVSGR